MKAVKVLVVLFFLFAFATSPQAFAQAAPASGPVAQIPEMSFDFGSIMEGNEYVHDFKIKNVGTAPLEIKKVVPG